MPKYKIITEVYSPAQFQHDVEIGGYIFNSVREEKGTVEVSKELKADSWRDALGSFNDDLWPIIDAIAFHRLSAMSSYGVSTVIQKEGIGVALALLMKKSPGVGLSMYSIEAHNKEREEILELANNNDPALGHFRSSMLATGANSITFNLLQSAESLAGAKAQSFNCDNCGKKLVCKNCGQKHRPVMSDRERLRKILSDELYNFYYTKQDDNEKSYRNMLVHGDYVDENVLAQKVEPLYEVIKDEIKNKYDLKHMRSIRGVRNINGYGRYNLFIAYEEPLPTNAELLELVDSRKIGHNSKPYRIVFEDDKEYSMSLDTY